MERFLVVTGDFVDTGGMDVANYAFARHLAKRGDEVHLVAHRVASELSHFGNVTVHKVPRPGRSHLLGSPLLDVAGRFRSLRLGKPRRVVVNGGNCGSGDVNWVHYLHSAFEPAGSAVPFVRAKQKLVRPWLLQNERAALRRAKVIIANSQRTRTDILQHLDVPAARVHTVYYGTDASLFAPVDESGKQAARAALGWNTPRPVAVFIGALGDRRKGFDVLFDAWTRVCRTDWDTELVVVGEGAELSVWRAKAAMAGLQERIRFLGFRSDVPRILQASDLLISPTRYEAYGLGVHEALCCGLPAVVSQSAGVAERFSPGLRSLLLANPDDVSDLVRLLELWRERREHFAGEARKLSSELRQRSWDDMAREILSLL